MMSLVGLLEAATPGAVPLSSGYLVYSWLCRSLAREVNLHGGGEAPPGFCLSALWPWEDGERPPRGEQVRSFAQGTRLGFRIAFARDEDGEAFAAALEKRRGKEVRLGGSGIFRLQGLVPAREHPLVRRQSPDSPAADPGEELELRFLSPTGFKRQGKQYLLPEPKLVFGSLLRKWKAWVDPAVEDLEELYPRVGIGSYELRTQAVRLERGGVWRGFVGSLRYDLRDLEEWERRVLGLLGRFAFYVGVGYKTAQGMGQVLCPGGGSASSPRKEPPPGSGAP
jgi:CRISPR-associated endoribonuclease Cas6